MSVNRLSRSFETNTSCCRVGFDGGVGETGPEGRVGATGWTGPPGERGPNGAPGFTGSNVFSK